MPKTLIDNATDYFPKSVLGVAREIGAKGSGKLIAAWNGLFFGYDHSKNPPNGLAKHIGPVVIEGAPSYNVGRNRWTFGLSKSGRFETRFKPRFDSLTSFRYAADGAQCLIRDGVALRIEPTPMLPIEPGTKPARIEPTFEDAGHIPIVDHIRTSRISMGWTRDSKKLYVLIVFEPDTETESIRRLRQGLDLGSGWDLFDLQRFWLSMDVWGAVNIDGGNVTQFVALNSDGHYEFQPSVSSGAPKRMTVVDENQKDPGGGTLLTFWIREKP
jgi:Phosphodiester glycosidase